MCDALDSPSWHQQVVLPLGFSRQNTRPWSLPSGHQQVVLPSRLNRGRGCSRPLPFERLLEAPACGSPLGVILEAGVPRTSPCTRSPWAPAEVVLPVGTIFKVLVPLSSPSPATCVMGLVRFRWWPPLLNGNIRKQIYGVHRYASSSSN